VSNPGIPDLCRDFHNPAKTHRIWLKALPYKTLTIKASSLTRLRNQDVIVRNTLTHARRPITLSRKLFTHVRIPITLSRKLFTHVRIPITLSGRPLTLLRKLFTHARTPITLSGRPFTHARSLFTLKRRELTLAPNLFTIVHMRIVSCLFQILYCNISIIFAVFTEGIFSSVDLRSVLFFFP